MKKQALMKNTLEVMPDIIRNVACSENFTVTNEMTKCICNTMQKSFELFGYLNKGYIVQEVVASYPYIAQITEKAMDIAGSLIQYRENEYIYVREKIFDFPDMTSAQKFEAYQSLSEQRNRHFNRGLLIVGFIGLTALSIITGTKLLGNKGVQKTIQVFIKQSVKLRK